MSLGKLIAQSEIISHFTANNKLNLNMLHGLICHLQHFVCELVIYYVV